MAIIPQAPGQDLVQQPAQSFIDTSPKGSIFRSELNERSSFVDPAKSFENYFGRVHRKYKSMDTTNIEKLANRLLQEQGSSFTDFVREETLLRDTFLHRFIEAKTPLGEVLQELQNSQESSSRKLLSRKTFNEAEKEVKELTEKEVALAAKKGSRREVLNEIAHLSKRQTAGATKIGPEFQVNTYITYWQIEPSVASLSNGKFVVTWTSLWQDGSMTGIYAQVFNADGTKNGSEFQVNSGWISYQVSPSIASLSNDKFVITWMSTDIYSQIFNADGTKSGSEFQVNTYTTLSQSSPSIASFSNDKFIIAWTSDGQDGDLEGVFGQIFNADGTKSGSEFQVNTYTTLSQSSPSVASLSNGNFVVTWSSDGQDGDLEGAFGQQFNADGTKSGSEFQINTYTVQEQWALSVASLSNGKFIVTWGSSQDGSYQGIYGQQFNADGTKSGSEFQINTYTTMSQRSPSVASFSNDQFIVTWQSADQDGSQYGVFGQQFNADGTKNGSEFQINTYTINNQQNPSVASLSNGNFVVTWRSDGQDGDDDGIYGQRFIANNLGSISTELGTSSGLSTDTRQTGANTAVVSRAANTAVVSEAERQTTSIALTALGWIKIAVKDALGY